MVNPISSFPSQAPLLVADSYVNLIVAVVSCFSSPLFPAAILCRESPFPRGARNGPFDNTAPATIPSRRRQRRPAFVKAAKEPSQNKPAITNVSCDGLWERCIEVDSLPTQYGKIPKRGDHYDFLRRKRTGERVSDGTEEHHSGRGGHSGVEVRLRGRARRALRGADVDAHRHRHADFGGH